MTRVTRNVVALLVGVCLGAWSAWSCAEDYPAVPRYSITPGNPCNFPGEVGQTGEAFDNPSAPILQCIAQWDARSTAVTNGTWGYSESPYDGWPHCSGASGYDCAVNVWAQQSPPNGAYGWMVAFFSVHKGWVCPSGGTLSSVTVMSASCLGAAACPAGQTRNASGVCQAGCTAGTTFSGYVNKDSDPSVVCKGGCFATVVSATNQAAANGVQVIAGSWVYTGESQCTSAPIASDGAAAPSNCPAGTCMGVVNGQQTCLACSKEVAPKMWAVG